MHEANEIIDGYFSIKQDARTFRVSLIRYGEKIKEIQPGRMLSLDELREMLVFERTQIFMEGVGK